MTTKGRSGCGKKVLKWGCLPFIALIVLIYIAGGGYSAVERGRTRSTQTAIVAATTVEGKPTSTEITTLKGTLTIPGEAVMDGRDLEASSPTIVTLINIWDAVPRQKVVCTLNHGDTVQLIEAKREDQENRYYFKVKGANCEGWVSEPFVSAIEAPPTLVQTARP